jgi:hypothetical protein
MSEDVIDVKASNWKEEVLESEDLVLIDFRSPQWSDS